MINSQRKQLTFALEKFYQNPIAMVSFELLLSLGAIIFFALFAIRPTLITMSDLLKEIEDKKTLETKMIQKIASLSSAQTQYLTLKPRLKVLDEAIPSNPELIKTLKIIEKIAGENQLAINDISLSEIPQDTASNLNTSKFKRNDLKISVTVKGDYPTLRLFIEELIKSRRTFIVELISFKIDENRGQKILESNVSLLAPYFSN